jgi:hypothetical protein
LCRSHWNSFEAPLVLSALLLWSPTHLLSIFTLVTLPLGVRMEHRHRVGDDRRIMILIFSGALVIAGLFTLVPGRIMHTVVFGHSTPGKTLSRRRVSSPEAGPTEEAAGAGFQAAANSAADRVSIWKNEGKNRSRGSVGGGMEAIDTLYDSHQELTGFPHCLTPKIHSRESRRRPRIFVRYPSSTR